MKWIQDKTFVLAVTALVCLSPLNPVSAAPSALSARVEKVWDPAKGFADCVWDRRVVLNERAFSLTGSVLVQDEDGCTHYANSETLGGMVCARKLFQLESPACRGARLFAFYGYSLAVSCNGTRLAEGRRLPSTGWAVWDVPPSLLGRLGRAPLPVETGRQRVRLHRQRDAHH
jgi:hypothetical protein